MQQKSDFFIDTLHIFVLFSFAVAQPLFDLLSRNAEFFVVRHAEPVDIILLILILCVLLPVLVVLIEVVAELFGRHARRGIHGFIVAVLVAIIVLPALSKIFKLPGTALLVGAAILGVGFTIAYIRFHPVRMFLTVLSPAILIFPGLFLFNSPVFKVVFPQKDPSAISVKVDNPCPIIFVVFDEFPVTSLMDEHRQIDPIRYPNFSALARDSYWFRNATTVADQTTLAVPAILTGNYPDPSRLPTAAYYPNNIFTLFGGCYDLKVFESITELCPERLCGSGATYVEERMGSLLMDLFIVYLHITLPQDLSADLPDITQNWMDFRVVTTAPTEAKKTLVKRALMELWNDRACQFEQFIDSIYSAKKPTLYFLDIPLPHAPYNYLPSGKKYGIDAGHEGLISGIWCDIARAVNQSYQRHLLQVGFVDTLIGKLIAHLKAVGLYNRSLIVITADHGVSFRPGDARRLLTQTNYQDIMPVPLFIKAPNQHEGVISDRNVETIDILPTIADILGMRLPWILDGRSALDLSLQERTDKIVYNNANERFVFDSAFEAKYVTLKRMLALFGSGSKPDGLFKIGPHGELVGRHMSEVGVAGQSDVEIQLDQSISFANMVTDSAFIPAQIKGGAYLKKDTIGRLNLAIVINGMVRAVTQTFWHETNKARFSAIVPEAAFHKGKNEVEFFIVSGGHGQLQLMRTKKRSTVTYSLAASSELGEIITSSNGTSIPVISNALKGHLDVADVGSDRVVFDGWAADIKNSQPPEAIVIFVNGKFFYSGHCDVDRPDVVKAYDNPALQRAGFRYLFPLSLFKNIDNSEVRIFAVSKEGVASELIYPKGYKLGKKS